MAMAMAVPSSHAFNYHVFLSFRGTDTRYGFTGNLYKALCYKGIHTFFDDEELQSGEEITPALVKAIQGSKIAIIVLSKDYASSSFCLDELSTIIHCAQSKGLLVIPVFYKVDPSDVRHQRGSYEDALTKHERRSPEKLQKWKQALHQVAGLSGYHFKEGDAYEYKFVENIVKSVSDKINHRTPLLVADHPVGLESRVAEVMKLLDAESDDAVLMIGIHGMGGLGKSTLARAVYNNLIAQRRGTDTRYGFTGNLYKALCNKGIHTFIDDEELQRGEEITPALFQAIEGSKIAIIVLSKHYASSSFCLDELSTIIHCMSKGLLVIPVFYMVDPSHVRHHKGSYGDALAKHERRFPENKLQKWKEALRQVANLSGYHFKDGDAYEYKFIENIVDWVSQKIKHPARLHVADHPVGLESRVAQVMELLNVGSDDGVHMVGIHGMGGVGKSTLARAVYNKLIAQNFDGFCYLENVREKSNKQGIERLQSILLSKILGEKDLNSTSWREGTSIIEDRLQGKKVLLVLDDVDKYDQLQAILGRPERFGLGSNVIITTRDQQLLKSYEIKRRYEVHKLNWEDSLQLLTWKAFKKEKCDPTYEEVLKRVLTYASGLPLALEVIGSNLFGKSIETWESAINQYKRIPHTQIQDILKVSFDTLQEEEKSVFLDIACCFNGCILKEVEAILSILYDDSIKHHIDVLVDKSLIKVNEYPLVKMHDLLQDMGRQIERKKSPKKPEKCERLWLHKEIIEVLKHNKGTSEIETIYLDVPISNREEIIEWDGNGFKEMKNLKILIIRNAKFSESPKCLPNSLRVLEWWGYPSNCLPFDFQPHKFVMCNLPQGCFTSFELDRLSKMLKNLTVLKFDRCKSLTLIPDVSHFSNLEELSFSYCDNLVAVHKSIGRLGKVKKIWADNCRNLVSFPPIHVTSLEQLDLSRTGLESFPEISGNMENIRKLYLHHTPIKELPISFVNLIGLQHFFMHDYVSVVKLPSSILVMPELVVFETNNCKGVKWVKEEENEEIMGSIVSSQLNWLKVPSCNLGDDFFSIIDFTQFAHVQTLDLSGNNFTFLPECIKEFQSLRILDVSDCELLQEIRGVPPNIREFNAVNCKSLSSSSISMFMNEEQYEAGMENCGLPGSWIPEWFEHKSRGHSISFWFRSVRAKILCLVIVPLDLYDFIPTILINGKIFYEDDDLIDNIKLTEMDHTYLFDLRFELDLCEVALEKEWNHLEVTYAGRVMETSMIKAMGIHVFKRESGMKNIRFSDPSGKRKLDDYLNSVEEDI